MNAFSTVKRHIEEAKSFGYCNCDNGSELFGRTPHIAPEAWLHQMYSPLNESDLKQLQNVLGKKIPLGYQEFLRSTNGINLFSDSLSLAGLRRNYHREGDDIWQPYHLEDTNVLEVPQNTKDSYFFIGNYNWDNSKLFIDNSNSKVYRCSKWDASDVKNTWESFDEMLLLEFDRLQSLFDEKGKEIDPSTPTVPE